MYGCSIYMNSDGRIKEIMLADGHYDINIERVNLYGYLMAYGRSC